MGMDLIVAVAWQRHPERTVAELNERIGQIDARKAAYLFEDYQQINWEEFSWFENEAELVDFIQGKLRDALGELTSSRGIMLMESPDGTLLALGGGSSWGDTPEGYDEIALLEAWGEW